MAIHIRRREFIFTLGGAVAAWPLAAHAQQPERMRRVGVLMNLAADDPEGQTRIAAFAQGLAELGWTIGRNLRLDYRWGAGDAERIRKDAAELVALAPDVILSSGTPSVAACARKPGRNCGVGQLRRLHSMVRTSAKRRVDDGEIRADPRIAREILEFIEERRVLSVAMTDGIIGCPHQEGIDYEGEWCPLCQFWYRRDRFTGQPVH